MEGGRIRNGSVSCVPVRFRTGRTSVVGAESEMPGEDGKHLGRDGTKHDKGTSEIRRGTHFA